jgi:SulP family sulfate permease
LVIGPGRVVRERQPDSPACGLLAMFSLEGEFFFGAAPELDEFLAELSRRADQGARVVVLRLKRVRNPDMVCLERLERFIKDMDRRGVPVLLCGVRPDFAQAMQNLEFLYWLPADRLFLEEERATSSTLKAVQHAYAILGKDRCPTCPGSPEAQDGKGAWSYMI